MKFARQLVAGLTIVLVLGGCVTKRMTSMTAFRAGIATGFINKVVLVNDKPYPYVVYVPRDYDPERAWPLIVFLHGAGERGHDGLHQTDVGLGHAIRRNPEWFPCLVLMPQCPPKVWWDAVADSVERSLLQTCQEYNVGRSRIYLTGLSMGGYATWQYGGKRPDLFAALMPICGGGNVDNAPALAKLPIWAFHGANDDVIDPEESRKMVEAVQQAGGKVKYTEFEDTGHNAWDKAYGDAKHIKWLLKQHRPE